MKAWKIAVFFDLFCQNNLKWLLDFLGRDKGQSGTFPFTSQLSTGISLRVGGDPEAKVTHLWSINGVNWNWCRQILPCSKEYKPPHSDHHIHLTEGKDYWGSSHSSVCWHNFHSRGKSLHSPYQAQGTNIYKESIQLIKNWESTELKLLLYQRLCVVNHLLCAGFEILPVH